MARVAPLPGGQYCHSNPPRGRRPVTAAAASTGAAGAPAPGRAHSRRTRRDGHQLLRAGVEDAPGGGGGKEAAARDERPPVALDIRNHRQAHQVRVCVVGRERPPGGPVCRGRRRGVQRHGEVGEREQRRARLARGPKAHGRHRWPTAPGCVGQRRHQALHPLPRNGSRQAGVRQYRGGDVVGVPAATAAAHRRRGEGRQPGARQAGGGEERKLREGGGHFRGEGRAGKHLGRAGGARGGRGGGRAPRRSPSPPTTRTSRHIAAATITAGTAAAPPPTGISKSRGCCRGRRGGRACRRDPVGCRPVSVRLRGGRRQGRRRGAARGRAQRSVTQPSRNDDQCVSLGYDEAVIKDLRKRILITSKPATSAQPSTLPGADDSATLTLGGLTVDSSAGGTPGGAPASELPADTPGGAAVERQGLNTLDLFDLSCAL
ncbi:hypothetical protein I4F81_012261 [Pyropia yezoensis]|uniref:Uncharacterized protein n=1 Tax=Pyropia yezoensis TaxID=2788 RepID=A0ACC3CIL5_PYRYE|nr:hypothetical protein I4F81_012261 [Neopyropia yezoensis]